MQFGVEDREPQPVAGEPVAVLARDAGDAPSLAAAPRIGGGQARTAPQPATNRDDPTQPGPPTSAVRGWPHWKNAKNAPVLAAVNAAVNANVIDAYREDPDAVMLMVVLATDNAFILSSASVLAAHVLRLKRPSGRGGRIGVDAVTHNARHHKRVV